MNAKFRDALNIRYFEDYGVRSVKYCAEVSHPALNEYRLIIGSNEYILKNKIDAYLDKLRDKWERLQDKNNIIYTKETGLKQAEIQTKKARQSLLDVEEILLFTLGIDDTVNWNSLKSYATFLTPHPQNSLALRVARLEVPIQPTFQTIPQEPVYIAPELGSLDKLIKPFGDKKRARAQQDYEAAYSSWQLDKEAIEQENKQRTEGYQAAMVVYRYQRQQIDAQIVKETSEWENQKKQFEEGQQQANASVDQLQEDYFKKSPAAVIEYCEIVLNNSLYPESFPKSYELDYNPDSGILVVDFTLPAVEDLPTLQEVWTCNKTLDKSLSDIL